MRNLFLIIAINFVGLANAENVKVLDTLKIQSANLKFVENTVLCIKGYVFIQESTGNIVQFFKRANNELNDQRAPSQPLLCKEWTTIK